MGNVLPAGQGQAPARQAALGAGSAALDRLHHHQQDVRLRHEGGHARARPAARRRATDVMVAGGMESMTNAPYLLPKARAGLRLGHGEVKDHMFLDGLEDAYDRGRLMGTFAEDCAGEVRLHARSAGPFRHHFAQARAGGDQERLVRVGNRADED